MRPEPRWLYRARTLTRDELVAAAVVIVLAAMLGVSLFGNP